MPHGGSGMPFVNIIKWIVSSGRRFRLRSLFIRVLSTKRVYVLSALVLLFIFSFFSTSDRSFAHLENADFSEYLPFEPELKDDFPLGDKQINSPRIPHIIHQTSKHAMISWRFKKYIHSFANHNPEWDYFLWTDNSARDLIKDRHPYLLKLWDNYGNNINRADTLRFVVLYEFGGVYADLDMEAHRSLDRATLKYSCVIPIEPFEHSVFRLKIPYLLSNAFMMCRPKHPFFKHVLQNLARFQPMSEQIYIAWTTFLTSQFMSYNNFSADDYFREDFTKEDSSPFFYQGPLPPDHENAVYIPNTRLFIDTLDDHYPSVPQYQSLCQSFNNLESMQKRACLTLYRRQMRTKSELTYTEHHWVQSYLSKIDKISALFGFVYHIQEIVPYCRIYNEKHGDKDVSLRLIR